MGYDCARFLSKVDEEFLCSICMLVIENPVQTPCEHLFCNKCITDWLCVNKRCPADSRPLTTSDLSNPYRILLNMLNKLECDFQSAGCQTVTKLENLEQHVSKCEYNLNGVVCGKGCNLSMTLRDYQKNDNCISHLAKEVAEVKYHFKRQDEEITKLRHELTEQKCRLERQDEEIRKLRDEGSRQKELLANPKTGQKQEIAELCADNLLKHNIKIGPLNLLQKDNVRGEAFVQSVHALKPTKSCFKIHCTLKDNQTCFIRVGLTREGFFRDVLDEHNDGDKASNSLLNSFNCKNGDVIECGIKFPKDFTNNGNNSAPVHLSLNQTVIFQKTYVIPNDGFFPTIFWCLSSDVKVRCYQQIN